MHRVSLVAGVGARGFEESGERRACERRLAEAEWSQGFQGERRGWMRARVRGSVCGVSLR